MDFNIILPSIPRPSKWFISFRFPHQNAVLISLHPSTCNMPLPTLPHSSWFYHPNDDRVTQKSVNRLLKFICIKILSKFIDYLLNLQKLYLRGNRVTELGTTLTALTGLNLNTPLNTRHCLHLANTVLCHSVLGEERKSRSSPLCAFSSLLLLELPLSLWSKYLPQRPITEHPQYYAGLLPLI